MPPRADAHDRPAENPPDAVSVAALVEARYRREIAVYRDLLAHTAADHRVADRGNRWPAHARLVEGLSLLDPDLRIHLFHTHQDGGDLGSFPPGENALALRIHVRAFPAQVPARTTARGQLVVAVSTVEADGWVRALLGDHWTDHSYEILLRKDQGPPTLRGITTQRLYLVLLDQQAQPMLAPDNFDFRRVWLRVDSARKIAPRSRPLAERIRRDGPYIDTAAIRDPRTDTDGTWLIDVTGADPAHLTPLAGDTATRLIRSVRTRGALDTPLRPLRVHIGTTVLWVYFQWEGDPETYAVTLRPPHAEDDLQRPPWHTPAAIVAEVLSSWREELLTGLRRRGHRTPTADGALHLLGPTDD